MKLLLKAAQFLIGFVLVLYVWNALTCQYCPKDDGPWQGSTMTMQECAIHGENRPITKAFVWVGWQINIWIPYFGCFSNDPTPVEVFGFRVEGWFKGWHQVKIVHLRYGG